VSGSSDDTFWARQCFNCKELLPIKETVCYCDGPVMVVELQDDKEEFVEAYYNRRMMWKLRKGYP